MADLQKTMDVFSKKGFTVKHFATADEACGYLCEQNKGTTIGFGGSMTLKEMGLYKKLIEAGNVVASHTDVPGAPSVQLERHVKVYITSANAITATGEIINIDARGNRIAQSVYGSEKVYFVVGANKLTDDLESGIWRAKNIASPKNAQRLHKKTPCAVKGDKCYNCSSPDRICCATMIIDYKMMDCDMEIIFIDQPLGY